MAASERASRPRSLKLLFAWLCTALIIAVYTCGTVLSASWAYLVAGLAAFTEIASFVVLSAIPAAADAAAWASIGE